MALLAPDRERVGDLSRGEEEVSGEFHAQRLIAGRGLGGEAARGPPLGVGRSLARLLSEAERQDGVRDRHRGGLGRVEEHGRERRGIVEIAGPVAGGLDGGFAIADRWRRRKRAVKAIGNRDSIAELLLGRIVDARTVGGGPSGHRETEESRVGVRDVDAEIGVVTRSAVAEPLQINVCDVPAIRGEVRRESHAIAGELKVAVRHRPARILAAGGEPGTHLPIVEVAHVAAIAGVSACNAAACLVLVVRIAIDERISRELGEDCSGGDKAQNRPQQDFLHGISRHETTVPW
jgi:hypothetical protein